MKIINETITKTNEPCAICGRVHPEHHIHAIDKTKIKGVEVEYLVEYFQCEAGEGEDFRHCPAGMFFENLNRARNAYRKKFGLLTSNEIISIRKKYNLTQLELARAIGLGDVTITRYETTTIQDPIYDMVLREIDLHPMTLYTMLSANKNKFKSERFEEIKNTILEKEKNSGRELETRENLLNVYKLHLQKDINSNPPDIDIIEKIVTYFAIRRKDLCKTMLMKFLWYADKLYFKKHNRSLTNLVYIHEKYGALPIGHYELIGLNDILKEEYMTSSAIVYHILPNPKVDITSLGADIIEILDNIIDKFKSMSTEDIVSYMHKEKAYKSTKQGEIISF